jgi:hypothetical protein
MLQNKLTEIKGRLLEMMFEMYRDMNTDEKGIDYETFYDEVQSPLHEIRNIHNIDTLNDLEVFCEGMGFNDEITNPFSFPTFVKMAYES